MCFLCFSALTVLYCLSFSAFAGFFILHSILWQDLKWRIPSVPWLLMYLTGPWRKETLKFVIFFSFPSTDRTSDKDKDCPSDPICCSETPPLPKLGCLSAAPHSRVRPKMMGDHSLGSSVFAEMPGLTWGCGTASSKERCRWSLSWEMLFWAAWCVEGAAICWQRWGSKMWDAANLLPGCSLEQGFAGWGDEADD